MEQGNIDRLLEVLADLGFGSVEEFFDYFPYDRIFNEIWEGRLEANSLTEIAFAAHISAQYAMQFAPTFSKVEEFMRGENEINAEVYNFSEFPRLCLRRTLCRNRLPSGRYDRRKSGRR